MTELEELKFTVTIHASPAEVWGELFRQGQIRTFYLGTLLESDLSVSSAIRCVSTAGVVRNDGEILEIKPPVLLRQTFRQDRGDEFSFVRWSLEEDGGGCRVSLSHQVCPGTVPHRRAGMLWPQILSELKRYVEVERHCRPARTEPNPFRSHGS